MTRFEEFIGEMKQIIPEEDYKDMIIEDTTLKYKALTYVFANDKLESITFQSPGMMIRLDGVFVSDRNIEKISAITTDYVATLLLFQMKQAIADRNEPINMIERALNELARKL
jgi:hypothetical protein